MLEFLCFYYFYKNSLAIQMNKNNLVETADMWATTTTWEEYQNIRLQRLKQQRQRMETMKDAVDQYSRIITDLQTKNKMLAMDNQQLRRILSSCDINNTDSYNLSQKYMKVCAELDRERKLRQNCQFTIESLRKELTQFDIYKVSPACNINTKVPYDSDYQVLQGLYDELKNQVYYLHKQNLSLKEVIRDQSRLNYQKDMFWKTNQKQNRPGMIRVASSTQIQGSKSKANKTSTADGTAKDFAEKENSIRISKQNQKSALKISMPIPSQQSISQSNKTSNDGYNEKQKQKIKSLKLQNKKQAELIDKFKQNQKQQLDLIDLLKSQKSKVCLCHSQGKSSKKILTSKGQHKLVSFKKDLAPN